MSDNAAKLKVVPQATYRVQMRREFGFDHTAAIADYLADLGVSHLYASPYLQAAPGSTHGYDVLDHTRPNQELGGAEGHERMCAALGRAGLGQILDIVPNHMSIASRNNAWWWDVLENGPASRYAAYFDVDWHPPETKLRDTVLLPILGDHYGRVLEAGAIQLRRHGGAFIFVYGDHIGPAAPPSLARLLHDAAVRAESDTLEFLADAFGGLPPARATDRTSVQRRHRDKEVLRRLLERLCGEDARVAAAIDEVVAETNASPDEMDALLDRQNFRLAYWRTAEQELDYRRFFDVNTLVSLRMEDDKVFADTHVRILEWLAAGVLDGVRVDHPDGLRDPQAYFVELRKTAPVAWIVAEKILEPGEALPSNWPVEGTTGYDFLNRLGGIYVDPDGERPLTDGYREFSGESTDYAALAREKKRLVLRHLFGSDVNRLTELLARVCERNRRYRDTTRREIDVLLRETVACFPVYRSYVRAPQGEASADDERFVAEAIEAARAARPELDAALFDFLRDLLLLRVRGELESEFVMRFQQLTGPVMAKGIEDTAFYNFNRLTALNEVGGDPGRWGLSLEDFHQQCREAGANWPHAMLASTTHDTKRNEDVRARIALLSEIPTAWLQAVGRWSRFAERHLTDGQPDRNTQWLLFQTLVGAWPLDQERASAYLLKAIREAKRFTSWTDPRPEYENAVAALVAGLLGDADFLADLAAFVAPLVEPGRINMLSQTLVKLTAPGVPDIFQGTEVWNLSLVDPDNRRPVDFELLRRLLGELADATPEQALARMDEGAPKMWLIRQVLHFRRAHSAWFAAEAVYRPLVAQGGQSKHVVAFARGDHLMAIAPRWPQRRGGSWSDTTLDAPPGRWKNLFTGEEHPAGRLPIADVLRRFPVALLWNADSP